ncbi:transposase [Streptomyces violascens]|uniref:transposase n=1 Tax=Streptomyces violascens TaxID=67381 RepID=UPI003788049F
MAAPRKYPLELRERTVRMYRTTDPKPQIKRLAVDLCVHPEALRGWIRQDEAARGERDDRLTTAEREELATLRKENAQLKRANEIQRGPGAEHTVGTIDDVQRSAEGPAAVAVGVPQVGDDVVQDSGGFDGGDVQAVAFADGEVGVPNGLGTRGGTGAWLWRSGRPGPGH